MSAPALDVLFNAICTLLAHTTDPPGTAWRRILEIVGESTNPRLLSLDFESAAVSLTRQLGEITAAEAPPNNLSFLYFGLFDLGNKANDDENSRVGFYAAAGTDLDAEHALRRADLSYLPKRRFLDADILDRIRKLGTPRRPYVDSFSTTCWSSEVQLFWPKPPRRAWRSTILCMSVSTPATIPLSHPSLADP